MRPSTRGRLIAVAKVHACVVFERAYAHDLDGGEREGGKETGRKREKEREPTLWYTRDACIASPPLATYAR